MLMLFLDIRYALRSLIKSPALAITAVASMAVGIGANTAIFSMRDAVFWRALPVREPHRLVRVGVLSRSEGRIRGMPSDIRRISSTLPESGQRLHKLFACAASDGLGQIVQQHMGLAVEHAVTLLNRALPDGLRQGALAGVAGTEKQRIFRFGDEGARRQIEDQAAIHLRIESKVEVVQRLLWVSKGGLFAAPLQEPIAAQTAVRKGISPRGCYTRQRSTRNRKRPPNQIRAPYLGGGTEDPFLGTPLPVYRFRVQSGLGRALPIATSRHMPSRIGFQRCKQ